MVVALVILTVVLLVTLDYFVVRKRMGLRQHHAGPPVLEPLSNAASEVPGGVFLQPSYTWSRIRPDGDLIVGVHPLLLGLVGAPFDVDLLRDGTQVERGAPLVRLGRAGRQLTVRSPVDGRVTAVNRAVTANADWETGDGTDRNWIYRIRPNAVGEDVPRWMIGDRAVAWTHEQYDRIRVFLAGAGGAGPVGATMADGGEIPVGILAALDEDGWEAFQASFLDRQS